MNPSIHQSNHPPPRAGDRALALPDNLIGRCNAVFTAADGRLYYRLKFPLTSPYFWNDAGAVFRAHEVRLVTGEAEIPITIKLPRRPPAFKTP